MLTTYKTCPSGLECFDQPVNGGWIDASNPSPDEIEKLKSLGVEPDLINYSLDVDEMARTERDETYTLILLSIPYRLIEDNEITYDTVPMGIILMDRFVITICKMENDIVKMIRNGKYRMLKTAKRYRFALYILLETATRYLTYIREIDRAVDALEDRLLEASRNQDIHKLLRYQKSLVYLTTALKSNQVMMERLQRMQMFYKFEEDKELLEDVITEFQQANEMVKIANDITNSMMSASGSLISNNLNVVMKMLAAITIVISLPTMVASFYGMNVRLPFEGEPWAFAFTLGIAGLLLTAAIIIFIKRDWF